MSDQEDARAVLRLALMSGDEVVPIVLLLINVCGEAEGLKTFLQVRPDAINTGFGIGAGVDIHYCFQVIEVRLHDAFCSFDVAVFTHITPAARNCSISSSL